MGENVVEIKIRHTSNGLGSIQWYDVATGKILASIHYDQAEQTWSAYGFLMMGESYITEHQAVDAANESMAKWLAMKEREASEALDPEAS